MVKKFFVFFRKMILAIFFIYGYNLISAPLGIIIPINLWTVSFITFLGVPALLSLITVLLLGF